MGMNDPSQVPTPRTDAADNSSFDADGYIIGCWSEAHDKMQKMSETLGRETIRQQAVIAGLVEVLKEATPMIVDYSWSLTEYDGLAVEKRIREALAEAEKPQ